MNKAAWSDEWTADDGELVERLVLNAHFRAWVLAPTPDAEVFWSDFQQGRADRQEAVRQARTLVLALQHTEYPISSGAVAQRTDQLLRRIRQKDAGQPIRSAPVPRIRLRHNSYRWGWVAAATILVVAGGLFWRSYSAIDSLWSAERPLKAPAESAPATLSGEIAGTVTEERSGYTMRQVTLPDGSIVRLHPNSVLRYTVPFGVSERTVTLTGEAFFDVKRNPKHPFVVWTDKLVTRVLGTSFTVNYRPGRVPTVTVRTGRVAVYARHAYDADHLAPLLLTPNQQAVLSDETGGLTRSVVGKPQPLPNAAMSGQTFDDRPVTDVLAALEQAYGVPIRYDQARLGGCRVTVTLEHEPLFDQLTLLCKLLDGHYTLNDGTIVLSAKGCQ